MSLLMLLQSLLLLAGAAFFLIGSIGLIRLPDAYCRIHALTKVDNLGLGLIVLGLLPSAGNTASGFKLLLIWLLVLAGSATVSHLVANAKYHREEADRPRGEGGE